MFRVAKQNRIFQDVVEQIQDAILRGDLNPGDILPPERDLKDMFQTSRGTLREALRVLEQKGLVEIKLGVHGGAVVKAVSADPFSESLDLLIRFRKISLHDLAEFRENVEGVVAAMAAERATQNDVAMLESLLAEARMQADAGPGHWDAFIAVDKKFHQALAKIARNPIYVLLHQMVHDNIQRYYDDFLPPDQERLNENFKDLSNLMETVRNGRSDDAREVARRHVRRFNQYMQASAYQKTGAMAPAVSH
jgi:DNA-binding FadR family transcriptional regulator